ncbi:MAG: ATP-binding protein [Myxococcota bacterium]|nr:ATP-binding protein [Myxococcota bacterium]
MRSTHGAGLLAPYVQALRDYLREGTPELRAAAFEQGRAALATGVGLLELVQVHRRFVAEHPERSLEFLAEVMGPFEMALRGYRDANSALRTLSSSLRDQVEQRTAELREAERRYRALVEGLPAVTYVSDGGGTLEYVSPQLTALLGFSPEEWLTFGAGWMDRIHPDERDLVEDSLHKVEPGSRSALEYRLKARDGQFQWVRDDRLVLTPDRHQGLWMDITQLRRLEDQLRHSQKMDAMGQLASGVAHDFNNILTAILSFGGFVKEDLAADHPSRPDIEEVLRAGERGAGLTRQLLALSRRTGFSPSLLDLNDLVREMEKLLQRLIGEQVQLVSVPAEQPWLVLADRGQLEQVLLNLVVNARDAMPQGGKIQVEVANVILGDCAGILGAPPGDYAQLAVTDTGTGMDAATLARIFEPFFTTKGKDKGTGLGLPVATRILKQANGDLGVESAPDQGTTFRVYLPRAQPTLPQGADGRLLRPGTQTGTETVLLVEDDLEVRMAARRILSARGYRVLEACSAEEALALAAAEQGTLQLLLTDVVMPGLPGPRLAERLQVGRPELKVVFMSGHTGESTFHEAALPPGAALVQKPFTAESLAHSVREALDARGAKV